VTQTPAGGDIVIPAAQAYATLQQDIGAMRTDMSDLKTSLSSLPAQVADHEVRIRRLERALWTGVGFSAAIGSAAGAAFSKLLG
jgi:hypothetical protein